MHFRRFLSFVLAMSLLLSSVTVAMADESFDAGDSGYSSADDASDAGDASADDTTGADSGSEQQEQEPESEPSPDDGDDGYSSDDDDDGYIEDEIEYEHGGGEEAGADSDVYGALDEDAYPDDEALDYDYDYEYDYEYY